MKWTDAWMCILFPIPQLAIVSGFVVPVAIMNAILHAVLALKAAPVIQYSIATMSLENIKWTMKLYFIFLIRFPQTLYWHDAQLTMVLLVYDAWLLVLTCLALHKTINEGTWNGKLEKWKETVLAVLHPPAAMAASGKSHFWIVVSNLLYFVIPAVLYLCIVLDTLKALQLTLIMGWLGLIGLALK